ncbi:hypothetical protein DRO69_12355 [Candidatus Bathyarchaeota archaeon]|nr:MAG: hypothetical protein DRO69_12355 [Candidatus Bathyarchaeota archaeon]
MGKPNFRIDQIESIVKGFLKQRYPTIKSLEIVRNEFIQRLKEWWILGYFNFNRSYRIFTLHISDDDGEITHYEIKIS